MSDKYTRRELKRTALRLMMIPIVIVVSYMALRVGIGIGNYLYEKDEAIIGAVDAENFKRTINVSLPIIDMVYNSGDINLSITGELKKVVKAVFSFDIDYPETILNVESPMFYSYYNYLQRKGDNYADTGDGSAQGDGSVASGDNSGNASGVAPGDGSASGTGTGIVYDGTGGNGSGGAVTGPDDNTQNGDDLSLNDGEANGNENGGAALDDENGGTAAGDGNSTNNGNSSDNSNGANNVEGNPLQLASSIEYDAEDEKIDIQNKDNSDIITHSTITVHNYTSLKFDIQDLLDDKLNFKFEKKGPKVLIYHTHTTESYLKKTQEIGKNGIPAYNSDPRYNVVKVGDELAKNLKKYGINVLHNGTVHDKKFTASYGASLKTLLEYAKSYPSIKIMFDIHRDGVDDNKLRLVTKINGKNVAQVMIVVGTNGNGLPHAKWKENLKFALKLQKVMNEKYPGLARPVWISKNRYNQQVTTGNLLIEIGGDGNVLSECLESTKYVAEAVNEVINGK